MELSVIICTYNPRKDYFIRVLEGLKSQNLPLDRWELLVVDNNSDPPVHERWDLSWHPNARYTQEIKLGLTHARLRGIRETSGDILLYVDDDNLLESDYLSNLLRVTELFPQIGAIGGSSKPEFEEEPTSSIRPYLSCLAINEIHQDYWSNVGIDTRFTPFGAGMAVRRHVAEKYDILTSSDRDRLSLDRVGSALGGHGDLDMALTAMDCGLGTGRFHNLRLTHLIAKRRLSEEYIAKLVAGNVGSMMILSHIRKLGTDERPTGWRAKVKAGWRFLHMLRSSRFQRNIYWYSRRSRIQAAKTIAASAETASQGQLKDRVEIT